MAAALYYPSTLLSDVRLHTKFLLILKTISIFLSRRRGAPGRADGGRALGGLNEVLGLLPSLEFSRVKVVSRFTSALTIGLGRDGFFGFAIDKVICLGGDNGTDVITGNCKGSDGTFFFLSLRILTPTPILEEGEAFFSSLILIGKCELNLRDKISKFYLILCFEMWRNNDQEDRNALNA
uniref:Uncharacterized protein n=1 Tax=Glossina pallidipes TaxID=7398 RepID=A0A1A9ZWW7_GLOPL